MIKNSYISSISSPNNNDFEVSSVGGTYLINHKEYELKVKNALATALIKSVSYEWGTGTLSIVTENRSVIPFPITKVGILISSYDSENLNVDNAEYAYIKPFTIYDECFAVDLTGVLHAVSSDSIIYVRAYMQYVPIMGSKQSSKTAVVETVEYSPVDVYGDIATVVPSDEFTPQQAIDDIPMLTYDMGDSKGAVVEQSWKLENGHLTQISGVTINRDNPLFAGLESVGKIARVDESGKWAVEDLFIPCTVTIENPDHCTIKGDGEYYRGQVVNLSVQPDLWWEFVSWSDGDTHSERTFTIMEDVSLGVILREVPHVALNLVGEHCHFVCDPESPDELNYEVGTEVTVTAICDTHYKWSDEARYGYNNIVQVVQINEETTLSFETILKENIRVKTIIKNDSGGSADGLGTITLSGGYDEDPVEGTLFDEND